MRTETHNCAPKLTPPSVSFSLPAPTPPRAASRTHDSLVRCGDVRRRHGRGARTFRAASAIEALLRFRAVQRRADDPTAEDRVSVIVHAHAASATLGPRPVLGHLDGLGPAQRAARARLLRALVREWRLAIHGFAGDAR